MTGWSTTPAERHHPYTLDGVQDALEDAARTYRKALWNDIDAYVEIWLEKDALTGIVEPITNERDVRSWWRVDTAA